MNIVIFSSTFLPNIGGLENVMAGLATNWASKSNKVTVYTKAPISINGDFQYNYNIRRNKSFFSMFKAVKNATIFVEANISLKTCLIGLCFFKKWVVIHHIPYNHDNSIKAVFKNIFTYISKNVAVSKYVAKTLYGNSIVIHNFYDPIYRNLFLPRKSYSLLFVGRLVSDKGVLLLLKAITEVVKTYPKIQLTIAGDGDQKNPLIDFVQRNKLEQVVNFCGNQSPENLCLLYNQQSIVVIPSVWEEPFGLVAIEALACGAKIIYSNGGGSPEVVDENCIAFNRGDVFSLELALIKAIQQSENKLLQYDCNSEHLKRFSIDFIANNYLRYFNKIVL